MNPFFQGFLHKMRSEQSVETTWNLEKMHSLHGKRFATTVVCIYE